MRTGRGRGDQWGVGRTMSKWGLALIIWVTDGFMPLAPICKQSINHAFKFHIREPKVHLQQNV